MKKSTVKAVQWALLLLAMVVISSGCFWPYGDRGYGRRGYGHDGGDRGGYDRGGGDRGGYGR